MTTHTAADNAAFIDVVTYMHQAKSASVAEVRDQLPEETAHLAWLLLQQGLNMRLFTRDGDTYTCRIRGSFTDNWVSDGLSGQTTGRPANPSEEQVNARLVDILDRLAEGHASMVTLRGDATKTTVAHVRPALLKGMELGLVQVSHDEDADWFRLCPNEEF